MSTVPGRVQLPSDLSVQSEASEQENLTRTATRKGMPCLSCVKETLKLKNVGDNVSYGGMLRVREVLMQCTGQLPRFSMEYGTSNML